MKTMAPAKFKATCLAVMEEVQAKREPVLITKNGKSVEKMVLLELAEVLSGIGEAIRMILLDTHVVLWMTTDKSQLSPSAANSIRDALRGEGGIAIASTTLWKLQ